MDVAGHSLRSVLLQKKMTCCQQASFAPNVDTHSPCRNSRRQAPFLSCSLPCSRWGTASRLRHKPHLHIIQIAFFAFFSHFVSICLSILLLPHSAPSCLLAWAATYGLVVVMPSWSLHRRHSSFVIRLPPRHRHHTRHTFLLTSPSWCRRSHSISVIPALRFWLSSYSCHLAYFFDPVI